MISVIHLGCTLLLQAAFLLSACLTLIIQGSAALCAAAPASSSAFSYGSNSVGIFVGQSDWFPSCFLLGTTCCCRLAAKCRTEAETSNTVMDPCKPQCKVQATTGTVITAVGSSTVGTTHSKPEDLVFGTTTNTTARNLAYEHRIAVGMPLTPGMGIKLAACQLNCQLAGFNVDVAGLANLACEIRQAGQGS